MAEFKLFTEEFKVARAFIADTIAACAPLKVKSPLWKSANAFARALLAGIQVALMPEVCAEVPDAILLRA